MNRRLNAFSKSIDPYQPVRNFSSTHYFLHVKGPFYVVVTVDKMDFMDIDWLMSCLL